MVEGSYCQYGMLNDTYSLRTTPTSLTPRRNAGMTTVSWFWAGWDDELEKDVPYWESLGDMFGGVGAPAQRTIMNVEPITKVPYSELVTQQFTYQELWYHQPQVSNFTALYRTVNPNPNTPQVLEPDRLGQL